ncbi:MAG: BglII/BstYI family type II restriction endonuclease [Actinomycetota bacterium]|nr:BglII/BstYI family type II restriction endonuclease [Actinomycetota bacterium]
MPLGDFRWRRSAIFRAILPNYAAETSPRPVYLGQRDKPSHEIDNFRNRIGIEMEWNNKTEFYDRDLNNFRLLWQLNVVSVGVQGLSRCPR